MLVDRGLAYTWGYAVGGPLRVSQTFPREVTSVYVGDLWGTYQHLPFPIRFDPGSNIWTAAYCNRANTLLLDDRNVLWAIPFQTSQQTGPGIAQPIRLPLPAGVTGWRSVATDLGAGYLISTEGGLYTFAANWTNAPVKFPADSVKTNWISLAATRFHALAVDADGRLFGWGLNLYGHLGPSATSWYPREPIPLHEPPGGGRWRAVRIGSRHSAGLTEDGVLFMWGRNDRGQLGVAGWYVPEVVQPAFPEGVNRWLDVTCGTDFTLGLGDDGVLYEWGSGGRDPSGVPEVRAYPPPVGAGGWAQATAGKYHRMALTGDGRLFAWGSDFVGQLGRGRIGNDRARGSYYSENESRIERTAVEVPFRSLGGTNRPPAARLLAPLHGSEFGHPQPLQLVAQVVDPEGSVAGVEFVIDATLALPARLETNGLYVASWPDAPQGEFAIKVRAVDEQGAEGWSEDNWLALLPYVTIEPGPTPGREPGLNDPGAPASFIIRRTGPTDRPLSMDVSLNTYLMTATGNLDFVWPYHWLPVTIPAGAHSVEFPVHIKADRIEEPAETMTVCIRIARAAPGTNVCATIMIQNTLDDPARPNQAPSIKLVGPGSGAVFLPTSLIPVWASFEDRDGYVADMGWFLGTNLLPNSNYVSEWFYWRNPAVGAHQLRARVTDNEGAVTWSQPMEITILNQTNTPGPNVIAFTALDPIAVRGTDDTAAVRVSRTGDASFQLTIFHAESGPAIRGSDYEDGTSGRYNFFVNQVSAVMRVRALTNASAPPSQAVEFRVTRAPPQHGGVYVPTGTEPSPAATIYLVQPPNGSSAPSPASAVPVVFAIERESADHSRLKIVSNPRSSFLLSLSGDGKQWLPFHQIESSKGVDWLPLSTGGKGGMLMFRAESPRTEWRHRDQPREWPRRGRYIP